MSNVYYKSKSFDSASDARLTSSTIPIPRRTSNTHEHFDPIKELHDWKVSYSPIHTSFLTSLDEITTITKEHFNTHNVKCVSDATLYDPIPAVLIEKINSLAEPHWDEISHYVRFYGLLEKIAKYTYEHQISRTPEDFNTFLERVCKLTEPHIHTMIGSIQKELLERHATLADSGLPDSVKELHLRHLYSFIQQRFPDFLKLLREEAFDRNSAVNTFTIVIQTAVGLIHNAKTSGSPYSM